MNLQSAIQFLYPPQCLSCGAETMAEFALCGTCWRDLPMIDGLACDSCGHPLPGDVGEGAALCDTCLTTPNPWTKGRAALVYDGTARRLILYLKHGDRQDLVAPMAAWMAARAHDLIGRDTLVAPVPLHWRRMFSRRFNQAALLAENVAKIHDLPYCPDLLHRERATKMQEHMNAEQRRENQRRAFVIPAKRRAMIEGRDVLLIDDVMTSGATLGACAEACLTVNAKTVNVLVLARVARDT
jgi:ComF family protein